MELTPRLAIVLGTAVACIGACNSGDGGANAQAAEEKKALEAMVGELKQPVALISIYLPHISPPAEKEKYAPARRPELDRSAAAAANEIRHAANKARQKMPSAAGAIGKDVGTALLAITKECADAADEEALAKCKKSVTALDEALGKAGTAVSAAGVTAKVPRVAAESITDEANKHIASLLKTKGPGKAEAEFRKKRADPNVAFMDLKNACQDAHSEVDQIAQEFEKADEPIRLIGVTHKMSMDSQCNTLNLSEDIRNAVLACKKKPTTPECKVSCSKGKQIVDNGVPAATFETLGKDIAEICKDDKK